MSTGTDCLKNEVFQDERLNEPRLCSSCILPENYPGVTFNDHGICSLCESYEPQVYLGEKRLKEDVMRILEGRRTNGYDCIAGFSGGRDSTYLLWYIVQVLKLKPLAVWVDSGYIPEDTRRNVERTARLLQVDLLVKPHKYLKTTTRHFLNAWQRNPEPATLINLCCGCRLGVSQLVKQEALKRKIPLIFAGGTPFEKGTFKKNLIATNSSRHVSFMLGYGKHVFRNPALVSDLPSLKIQIREYLNSSNGYIENNNSPHTVLLSPFMNYFRWEEKKVDETIRTEVGWTPHSGLKSSFRGDCEIGIIRQYLYYKMLGFNDKDDHLSWLIRDGQITRQEAIDRVIQERETDIEVLKASFAELDINFSQLKSQLEETATRKKIPFNSHI